MREANIKVPLDVSTVGLTIAAPLIEIGCTMFFEQVGWISQDTPCLFAFPQHEKKIQALISNRR
ncbi:MAG TPA: hypothetical protein VK209_04175 [Candidatus Sulfotelmatobacter sp.]|nr:hypothetical protein [Candidatus Sulfotelmatobacter sp.]